MNGPDPHPDPGVVKVFDGYGGVKVNLHRYDLAWHRWAFWMLVLGSLIGANVAQFALLDDGILRSIAFVIGVCANLAVLQLLRLAPRWHDFIAPPEAGPR